MMKALVAAMLSLAPTVVHAIDAACTTTTNLSIYRCPANSRDWYVSYTGIVDGLDSLAKTAPSSFTVLGVLQAPSATLPTLVSSLTVVGTGGVRSTSGTFTATGSNTFSIVASSGISIAAGGIKWPDGTISTSSAGGGSAPDTNSFQWIASTSVTGNLCMGFTALVASTTYVVEYRGNRASSAYVFVQAGAGTPDTGNNYYGGWRYINGSTSYAGSVNAGANIPLGEVTNPFTGTFAGHVKVITDWGLIKRLTFRTQWTSPNAAGDQFYGDGTSGGVYNGASAVTSIHICTSAGLLTGEAVLWKMLRQ